MPKPLTVWIRTNCGTFFKRWECQTTLLLLLLSRFSHVRPTLCDRIDSSPPGPAVPGILQARTLECVAISFSNAWKWKVKVKSLSRVQLLATPWTAAYQAPPSMGFSRQDYWSGVPLPTPARPPYLPPNKFVCKSRRNSENLTLNNGLVPNWERSISRLYIVTWLT